MKKTIFAAVVLAFSLPAMAQKIEGCSVKAWKPTTNQTLDKLATFPRKDAEKVALDTKTFADKKITESKLVSEDGCAVYQIDVMAGGDKTEFMIDAGNGRILRQRNGTIAGTAGTKIKEAIIPHKQN